jgi:hypothetical protein
LEGHQRRLSSGKMRWFSFHCKYFLCEGWHEVMKASKEGLRREEKVPNSLLKEGIRFTGNVVPI